jgi:hypothetical protein
LPLTTELTMNALPCRRLVDVAVHLHVRH